MSPVQQIAGTGLLILVVYVVARFYWLRVVGCAASLAIWALFAVVAPLYLAYDAVTDNRLLRAAFTLAISTPMTALWYLGFDAARTWVRAEMRYGRWANMPWNAP